MTKEQSAAFVNAQAALFNCELAAMIAENQQRQHRGESMAYVEKDFVVLIRKYEGILGWNAAIEFFESATS